MNVKNLIESLEATNASRKSLHETILALPAHLIGSDKHKDMMNDLMFLTREAERLANLIRAEMIGA